MMRVYICLIICLFSHLLPFFYVSGVNKKKKYKDESYLTNYTYVVCCYEIHYNQHVYSTIPLQNPPILSWGISRGKTCRYTTVCDEFVATICTNYIK